MVLTLTDFELYSTSDLWPQCSPKCRGGSQFPQLPLYSAERTTYTSNCPPHTPGSPCVWRTWQTSVTDRRMVREKGGISKEKGEQVLANAITDTDIQIL